MFELLPLFRVLTPDMQRVSWRLAATLSLVALAACRPEFELKKFTNNEALYTASLREFQRQHWDNAISGFEKPLASSPRISRSRVDSAGSRSVAFGDTSSEASVGST